MFDRTWSSLFADLIETDFIHDKDIAVDTDWVRQNYSVTAIAGRGTYGYVLYVRYFLTPFCQLEIHHALASLRPQ